MAATTGALVPLDGFTFGCDPELFIANSSGLIIPACGLIPGTKADPFKVEKGWVQVDGLAAEINTEPAKTFDEFSDNITTVLRELKAMLPPSYSLKIIPSHSFRPDVFDEAPDEAKEMGCSPDYNAWTSTINPPPYSTDPYLRCAGGHAHIGWTNEASLADHQHIMNCEDLVKQLDWYISAWMLSIDTDKVRPSLYGQSGAYRPKGYGVEFRTPSNQWITTKERRLQFWNRMQRAILDMASKYVPDIVGQSYNDRLIKSINTGTRDMQMEELASYPIRTLNAYDARF